MNIRLILFVAILAANPALALAQEAMPDMGDSPAAERYLKSMQSMQEGMKSTKPTGDADKDFVMMMMPHHQGAIDMARVELKYGKDKILRAMAEGIIKAQKKEIAEMKAWQAKHAR